MKHLRFILLAVFGAVLHLAPAAAQGVPKSFQANICGTVTSTSAPVCVQDGNGGNPTWGTINPTAHTFSVNAEQQAPAPGFYSYPAAGTLYAKFGATPNYLGGGAQTGVFATWLSSVSGTFTRAGSVGPAWDSSGLLINYAANLPRLSYDPVTLVPNLIYEPASSNLVQYSQQASNTVWRFTNTGIGTGVDNNATGLDGTTSAGTFRELTPSTVHQVWWRDAALTLTSGSFYAYQIFIKPVNRTKMYVTPSTIGNSNTPFYVDFANLTVTNSTWNIELLNNGFYRLYTSFAAIATAVPSMIFQNVNSLGQTTYAGSTAAGWDLGGAQLEAIASATSLPTTYMQRPNGTAVSRPADALAFTLPASSSKLTYTFANGQTQLVAVSPGAYAVPNTLDRYQIASFINVDLTQVAAPVLSVSGRTGNVALSQSDIAGLKTNDTARFSSLATSTSTLAIGPATFQNEGTLFRWTTSANINAVPLNSGNRTILIGPGAGKNLLGTSQSNNVIMGADAAGAATLAATSTIVGDTAGGSNPSISNSELYGNEAGNGPTILASQMFGNLAKGGGLGATVTRATLMGFQGSTFNGLVDTVALGANVLYGTSGAVGSVTQSLVLGSSAGSTVGAAATTMTNLYLLGYNVQPPTATTSNYLNFGNFLKSDLSSNVFTFTTQAGGAARLSVATLTLSGLPTSDPGVPGQIWNNGGVLNISPRRRRDPPRRTARTLNQSRRQPRRRNQEKMAA